jgi:hypothetical protein
MNKCVREKLFSGDICSVTRAGNGEIPERIVMREVMERLIRTKRSSFTEIIQIWALEVRNRKFVQEFRKGQEQALHHFDMETFVIIDLTRLL